MPRLIKMSEDTNSNADELSTVSTRYIPSITVEQAYK